MGKKQYVGVVVDSETRQKFIEKCTEMGMTGPNFFREILSAFFEDRLKILPGVVDKKREVMQIHLPTSSVDS